MGRCPLSILLSRPTPPERSNTFTYQIKQSRPLDSKLLRRRALQVWTVWANKINNSDKKGTRKKNRKAVGASFLS